MRVLLLLCVGVFTFEAIADRALIEDVLSMNRIFNSRLKKKDRDLFFAVLANNRVEAYRLISRGADPNVIVQRGSEELTPLHIAVRSNEPKSVSMLLKAGADVKARDNYGDTALHKMRGWDRSAPEILSLLLVEGADPNAKGNLHLTPLHNITSHSVNPEPVSILLGVGADPNAIDYSGRTPLHYVMRQDPDNVEVVALLLAAGADPEIEDRNGDTPLDIATNDAVKTLLQETDRISSSCYYVSSNDRITTKVSAPTCGNKILCSGSVDCVFTVFDTVVSASFQAICSAQSDGTCPSATQCAVDNSFKELIPGSNKEIIPSSDSSNRSSGGSVQ